MTLNEAVHEWVNSFNAIPQRMIEKLMEYDTDDTWEEITKPTVGSRVFTDDSEGKIVGMDGDNFIVETDDDEKVTLPAGELWLNFDSSLPRWGTMWSFDNMCDKYWVEKEENGGLQALSDCGFRVFRSEEYGIFFGLDGAGYNFYQAHWIPLYEARGMHWHDEETEGEL